MPFSIYYAWEDADALILCLIYINRMLTKTLRKAISSTTSYLHMPGHTAKRDVTLLPGIAIGPEIIDSVLQVFKTANVPVSFDILSDFDFRNESHRDALKKNRYLLIGNTGSKDSPVLEHLEFYKFLNLYARVVHIYNLPNVPTRHKDVDIVVIRENLEGEFSGVEHEVVPGVFESLKIITKEKSKQIAEYAFEHAVLTGRKKVSAVHKANIMKLADGVFLEATREVAKNYPSIKYEEIIIDNCAMQLVSKPQQFDIMVMPNLYGSIVSSIGAGLIGGAGVCAGASIGDEYLLFDQGLRNSGMDIAGKNIANPTALIVSSVNMLKSMYLPRFADLIHNALFNVYDEAKYLTSDVGGKCSTSDFTSRLCEEIVRLDNKRD